MATASKNQTKVVKLQDLPPIRLFGSATTITPSVEKSQISSITVENGDTQHEIFKSGKIVKGVHPNQAEYIFNLVIGATGTGRGTRQLGFAHWAVHNADDYKGLSKYDVIVEFNKRGGTMWFKFDELLNICKAKSDAAERSWDRFPRTLDEAPRKDGEPKEIEVSLML